MTKLSAGANAIGLLPTDPDYLDLAVLHLGTLLDMINNELSDVVRGALEASDAAALARADALAWIGRDFARAVSASALAGNKSHARPA